MLRKAAVLLIILSLSMVVLGCTQAKDPIIGTWFSQIMGIPVSLTFYENNSLEINTLGQTELSQWEKKENSVYMIGQREYVLKDGFLYTEQYSVKFEKV